MRQRSAKLIDMGCVPYQNALEWQKTLHQQVAQELLRDTLLLLEHPPTITLGRGFHEQNLRWERGEYVRRGITLLEIDRGGDVTFHGPGQLVGYPIFNLNHHGKDLHRYLRDLEEAIIQALGVFKLQGRRFPPHTGVWVGDEKVCAIGIKVSRWTSMHGFALNVLNNVEFGFSSIVPCGIQDYGVTSLSRLLDRTDESLMLEAKDAIQQSFEKGFDLTFEREMLENVGDCL